MQSNMLIVGFGHRKQVGKDTVVRGVSSMLSTTYPEALVLEAAFADELYNICHNIYGWLGFRSKQYYDRYPEEKEEVLPYINKTPRQVLIDFGTTGIRDCVWEETWSNYLIHKYSRTQNTILLISDLRFPNEFKAIKEAGGKCVKIERPGTPHSYDVADCALDRENGWDATLCNNGSPEKVTADAYELIRRWYA